MKPIKTKNRGIVEHWGQHQSARRVRLRMLPKAILKALKQGREIILTDCPPSHGRYGSTERKIIKITDRYYVRCID